MERVVDGVRYRIQSEPFNMMDYEAIERHLEEMAADEKIHDSDFGKVIIKGGEPASDAQKNELKIEVNKIIASYNED